MNIHLGQYSEARDYLERGLVISRQHGYREHEGVQLGNLGTVSLMQGNYQQAQEYLAAALQIARDLGDAYNERAWVSNLGIACRYQGNYRQAIRHFEQVLSIAREMGDRQMESRQIANLGIVYRDMSEWELASEHLESGLAIQREIGDRRAESNQLGNLGTVYQRMEDYEKAANYHQQALRVSLDIGDLDAQRRHLSNLGIVYTDGLKDDVQAYTYLSEAIDLTEQLRSSLVEGAFRMGYFRERLYVYRAMVGVCLRLGHRAEAWQFVERARSRVFLDALSHTEIAPPVVARTGHPARVRELVMAIRSQEVALIRLEDNSGRNRLARQIAQMQTQLAELLSRLEAIAPEYVALRLGKPATLQDIRACL